MKYIITTFVFAISPLIVLAQYGEDYEFDPDLTYYVWYYYGSTPSGNAFTEDYYLYDSYESDGKTYGMVLEEGDSKGAPPFSGGLLKSMIGIREKDGCVLVNREEYLGLMADGKTWKSLGDNQYIPYRQTDDDELVLYDYNMKPGDKFLSVEGHEDISVNTVEEITTRDGVCRRLLTLNNGYKLLEGIGCLNSLGLFFFYLNPIQNIKDYKSYGLYQFVRRKGKNSNVEIIYQEGDIDASGIKMMPQSSIPAYPLYDLQGHRIQNPSGNVKRGIYIQGGQKIIVR